MSSVRPRSSFVRMALAIFSLPLLGGCTLADSATWETFLTDLLRSAASALLL